MALEAVLVNNGGLDNVFVYVKDGLSDYAFDTPTEPCGSIRRCRYTPHVFGLRAGQPLVIANGDQTLHTVHAMGQANQEFNLSQPLQGISHTKTFTAPEVMVHFKCNVHTWMEASPGSSATRIPRSANGGGFELKGLPPGTYTVAAWHEKSAPEASAYPRREGIETGNLRVQGHHPVIWLHRFIKLVAACAAADSRGRDGHQHRFRARGAGLAQHLRPLHVLVPLEKMVGIFYEHGHRMIASTVGFLTIILAAWTWRVEPRRWLRRLGVIALVAVILQGVLGGITVLYLLPAPVSIGHAGLAQIFFCLTIALSLFTSPGWERRAIRCATRVAVADDHPPWSVQILLGATMRIEAGMAIPDFPLAFGHLVPPFWNPASRSIRAPRRRRGGLAARSSPPPGTSGITIADAASWRGRPRSSSCWCWCR